VTPPKSWAFTIYTEPVGKGRPRAAMRGGFVSVYTPKKTKDFEQTVADVARELFKNDPPITSPVAVKVLAAFNRPKSKSRKKDPDGLIPKTTRPDADNVLKAVLDALVAAGVLKDDAIVTDARCIKAHAPKEASPYVVVWIRETAEIDGTPV